MDNLNEDIKILEEHLNFIKNFDNGSKYIPALENLIKGYREKEESEAYLYDAYQDAGKKMFEYLEQLEDSVPKSKIREMIEEKQARIDKMHPASDCVLIDDLENQIEVLQELLGGQIK